MFLIYFFAEKNCSEVSQESAGGQEYDITWSESTRLPLVVFHSPRVMVHLHIIIIIIHTHSIHITRKLRRCCRFLWMECPFILVTTSAATAAATVFFDRSGAASAVKLLWLPKRRRTKPLIFINLDDFTYNNIFIVVNAYNIIYMFIIYTLWICKFTIVPITHTHKHERS